MKVIDNIAFCYDYDILEIRLSILYDYVDKFVILECDHTYTNLYKGYNFEKQQSRYKKWMDKIEYIKVKGPGFADPWDNEHWQWEQLKLGWKDVHPEDLVLLCRCADEIPRPEAIDLMKNSNFTFFNLIFPAFFMKFNYIDTNAHYDAWGKAFKGHHQSRGRISPISNFVSISEDKTISIHHAGWHLSYMGDEEWIKNKLTNFSHSEMNVPRVIDNINIDKHIANGEDCLNRNVNTFKSVNFDSYFPKYLLDNKEKYKQFILPDPNPGISVQDFHPRKILELE
jgi:hypothetical protein